MRMQTRHSHARRGLLLKQPARLSTLWRGVLPLMGLRPCPARQAVPGIVHPD